MLLRIVWMRTDENVAWVRIAVYEPRYKDLFGKGSNKIIHDVLFVKVVLFELLSIGYLKSIDPL